METFHDMHCHLDFFSNGEEVAGNAQAAGTLLFCNTVSPEGWADACARFAPFGNVAVGFGMHPWWIGEHMDMRAELDRHDPPIIGEVGLDLGKRHAHTAAEQRFAFASTMHWAAERGDKLISIHSVHAAREVIDVLEQTSAVESCTCIFHWFTGPSDQLKRAVQNGCYFSFGMRALSTGKGREYVKAVPAKRLLLETDYPPQRGDSCSFDALRDQLEQTARIVANIKGGDALPLIAETSQRLLEQRS